MERGTGSDQRGLPSPHRIVHSLISALLALLLSAPASAQDLLPEPVPVAVRGRTRYLHEVVALCPDVGIRPEVYLARKDGGLAGRLAEAGFLV